MRKQRLLFFTAVAGMVLVASSAAQASSIKSLFRGSPAIENIATDDSFEYLLDNNYVAGERGVLDVGDSLRGLFTITVVNGTLIGDGSIFGTEWTGVFQVKVTSKVADPLKPGFSFFTFGPDAAFAEAVGLGVGGEAMVIFYEDAAANYADEYSDANAPVGADDLPGAAKDSDVSVGPYAVEEAFIATASDGTAFWALGFTGAKVLGEAGAAAGEGWTTTASAPDDLNGPDGTLGGLFGIGSTTPAGEAALALNRVFIGGPGDSVVILPQASPFGGTVEFVGVVSIRGVAGGGDTPFEASDQSEFSFYTVPVPGAAWTGLAMLGLLGFVRRRRRAIEA